MTPSEGFEAIRTAIRTAAGIHDSLVKWSHDRQGFSGWATPDVDGVPAAPVGPVGLLVALRPILLESEHSPPRVTDVDAVTATPPAQSTPAKIVIGGPYRLTVAARFEALDHPTDAITTLLNTIHRLQYPAAFEAHSAAGIELIDVSEINHNPGLVDDRALDAQEIRFRWRMVLETEITGSTATIDRIETQGTVADGETEIAVNLNVERAT